MAYERLIQMIEVYANEIGTNPVQPDEVDFSNDAGLEITADSFEATLGKLSEQQFDEFLNRFAETPEWLEAFCNSIGYETSALLNVGANCVYETIGC